MPSQLSPDSDQIKQWLQRFENSYRRLVLVFQSKTKNRSGVVFLSFRRTAFKNIDQCRGRFLTPVNNGVTAAGAHPETAVQTMSRLCKEAEDSIDYIALQWNIKQAVGFRSAPFEWAAVSAVTINVSVRNAKAIIVVANSGHKAEIVAKYRPSVPILSVLDPQSTDWVAHGRGLVYRGIIPLIGSGALRSTEEMIKFGVQAARNEGICNVGDTVLALTSKIDGFPFIQPMVVD